MLDDLSVFEDVLDFVPKDSVLKEHRFTNSTLLIASGRGVVGTRMCELLLQICGSPILLEAKDNQGATALHIAAKTCNNRLIELFLTKYDGMPLLSSVAQVMQHIRSYALRTTITQGLTPYQSTTDEACRLTLTTFMTSEEREVLNAVKYMHMFACVDI